MAWMGTRTEVPTYTSEGAEGGTFQVGGWKQGVFFGKRHDLLQRVRYYPKDVLENKTSHPRTILGR